MTLTMNKRMRRISRNVMRVYDGRLVCTFLCRNVNSHYWAKYKKKIQKTSLFSLDCSDVSLYILALAYPGDGWKVVREC